MNISKYQFYNNVLEYITFDDYHEAIEDALSIYKINNKEYVVLWVSALKEEDNTDSYVVFEHLGFYKLRLVKDIDVVKQVLSMYENEE